MKGLISAKKGEVKSASVYINGIRYKFNSRHSCIEIFDTFTSKTEIQDVPNSFSYKDFIEYASAISKSYKQHFTI